MKILVSVIIPCTDRTEGLESCILSATNQDFNGEVEIILVENNSTNKCVVVDLVKRLGLKNLSHVYLELCLNANVARNYGTQVASGDYVAYLDSDDIWSTNHLASKLDRIISTGGVAVYGGANINKGNRITSKKGFPITDIVAESPPLEYLFGDTPGFAQTSSYLLSREAALEVKWDDELSRNQDYDFFIRVAKTIGWVYDPNVTYTVMWTAGVVRKHHFSSYQLFFLRYRSLMTNVQASNYLFDRMIETSLEDKEAYRWFKCEFKKHNCIKPLTVKGLLTINRFTMIIGWFAREYITFGRK